MSWLLGHPRAAGAALVAVVLLAVLAPFACREPRPLVEDRHEEHAAATTAAATTTAATSDEVTHVQAVEEVTPDGTRRTTTTTDTRRGTAATSTTVAVAASSSGSSSSHVETPAPRPRLHVEARAGWHVLSPDLAAELRAVPPVLGVTATVRVAGPWHAGVWWQRDAAAPRELRHVAGVAVGVDLW